MKNQKVKLSLKSNFRARVLLAGVLIIIIISGCGSTPKAVEVTRAGAQEAYEAQKAIVVRTSEDDKRPEWTKVTFAEKDGKLYFTGGFQNGSDYSLTVRCANAEAAKAAVQSISQFIRAEFSEYVQGSNATGEGVDRYVEDGIATFTECVHVQGVKQSELYYEEVFAPQVMEPAYNIWVKLEISKANYLRAKAEALRKLRDEFADAGQLEAKERAERLLEWLKGEVRDRI